MHVEIQSTLVSTWHLMHCLEQAGSHANLSVTIVDCGKFHFLISRAQARVDRADLYI